MEIYVPPIENNKTYYEFYNKYGEKINNILIDIRRPHKFYRGYGENDSRNNIDTFAPFYISNVGYRQAFNNDDNKATDEIIKYCNNLGLEVKSTTHQIKRSLTISRTFIEYENLKTEHERKMILNNTDDFIKNTFHLKSLLSKYRVETAPELITQPIRTYRRKLTPSKYKYATMTSLLKGDGVDGTGEVKVVNYGLKDDSSDKSSIESIEVKSIGKKINVIKTPVTITF